MLNRGRLVDRSVGIDTRHLEWELNLPRSEYIQLFNALKTKLSFWIARPLLETSARNDFIFMKLVTTHNEVHQGNSVSILEVITP
jgi:hypothetical protein